MHSNEIWLAMFKLLILIFNNSIWVLQLSIYWIEPTYVSATCPMIWNNAVENWVPIINLSSCNFGLPPFTRAKLPEILTNSWLNILKQLNLNSAHCFPIYLNIKEDALIFGSWTRMQSLLIHKWTNTLIDILHYNL